MNQASVAGVVLAAGNGTRMGGPKAELVVDGRRLLDRAIAALTGGGCRPVLAVVQAGVECTGATALVNPEPARGLRSSLEIAVDAAPPKSSALAVLLVDLPGIRTEHVAHVVQAWRPHRIAVGRYGTRRAHPVVMSAALWRAALALAGPDDGARALLAARPELVDDIDLGADAFDALDLDTPDDLRRWRAQDGS